MSLAFLGRLRASVAAMVAPSRLAPWMLAPSLLALLAGGCTSVADESGATSSAQTGGGETDGTSDVDGTTGPQGTSAGTTDNGSTSGSASGTTDDGTSGTTGEPGTDSDADDGLPVYSGGCDVDGPATLDMILPDGNAMASAVQARMAVLDGWGVFGELSVRPWEFLNYYPFDYPAADPGEVRVSADLYADPERPGAFELQIGVRAPILAAADRPPIDLTLVVDVSGSMKGLPLTMLRESGHAIAGSLRAGDTISIVTWDAKSEPLLAHYAVQKPSDPEVVTVFDALEATGGADLVAGLKAGYALAQEARAPGRIARVLLMSDGGAAADAQALDLIGTHALDLDGEGIYLLGVGVGSYGGYQPALMDSVTDAGRGASIFIGSADEAKRAFADRFVELMVVGARDLRVEITLPPGFRREAIEAFAPDDVESAPPSHLLPMNGALVYHERISTCAPELAVPDAEVTLAVTYLQGETFEVDTFAVSTTLGELLQGDHRHLHKGAGIVRYAEALRLWNMDPSASDVFGPVAKSASDRIALASKLAPNDTSLIEIQTVLEVILKSVN